MKVYVTGRGKTYHFSFRETNRGLALDDDCPVAASIIRGYTAYREMTEEEAIAKGYRPCMHCLKEYHEDKAEAQGCAAAFLGLLLLPVSFVVELISLLA